MRSKRLPNSQGRVPSGADNRLPEFAYGCLLAALTIVFYLPAFSCGFIWDDHDHVVGNATLRSADGLLTMWTQPRSLPQYYPLVHTTFWLEYRLWQDHPAGYHVTNVLLHAANAVLLWRILRLLAVPAAWFIAAAFALHPVHVESVAWITERKNTLSGFFYLAAALCYLHFNLGADRDQRPRWRLYALALVLFLAALLSKTVTASLPAALLLILWAMRGRLTRRELGTLAPMFVLAVPLALLTVWLEKHEVGARGSDWDLSLIDRCLIAGRAFWFYVGKLLVPQDLTFIYSRWTVDASAAWQYLFPLAALALVAVLWALRARLGKLPLVAVLFFAGTLTPALGFFDVYPMKFSYVADHFQYLASIGILALVGAAGWAALTRLDGQWWARPLAAGVLVLLGLLTTSQCMIYSNLETLWRDTLRKNPDSAMVHANMGQVMLDQARLDEAREHFQRAVDLQPHNAMYHNNLGSVLDDLGKPTEAIQHLRTALALDPDYTDALNNLGVVLTDQGALTEGLEVLQRALRLNPKRALAHCNLGLTLEKLDRAQEAEHCYETALALVPEYVPAHYQLGLLQLRTGRAALAVPHLAAVVRQHPHFEDAAELLVEARAQAGSGRNGRATTQGPARE